MIAMDDAVCAEAALFDEEIPSAVEPLIATLHQLFELLSILTDEQYANKPGGPVTSSIGGHLRHNLDHIEALIRSVNQEFLSYDHRDRDTEIERNRLVAMETILRLENNLRNAQWWKLPSSLILKAIISPDLPAVEIGTTIDREVAFVLSHTIHHNAIIAIMAKMEGVALPENFGYAPSTIAHQRSRSCAR